MNVLADLKQFVSADGKSINVPASQVPAEFGSAIGTALQEILSGSLQLNGVNFAISGDDATATISGEGHAPPLANQWNVTAVFTASDSGVKMDLTGSIQSDWALSNAWPSQLSQAPFTELTFTKGDASLSVDPSASSFDLSVDATVSYQSTALGTGLLVVSYDGKELGFLGGFIVSGSWSPLKQWPVLSNLSFTEGGAFASTIKQTDLSAFKSLNLAFTPDEVDPGLTFIASLAIAKDIQPLSFLFPANTTLDLMATVGMGTSTDTTLMAELKEPQTNKAFQFEDLKLVWDVTKETVALTITCEFQADAKTTLELNGKGTLNYSDTPSATIDVFLDSKDGNGWVSPFGIPRLTIMSFGISIGLNEEGAELAAEGVIEVGNGPGTVEMDLGIGIEDFEAPVFFKCELSSKDKQAQITLPQLIEDFIPELTPSLDKMPLLNEISFSDLELLVVAAATEVDNQSYEPGVGLTGDVDFFGLDIDFGFSLTTSPSIAVKAKGTISENGGPVVVKLGSLTLLTLSDAKDNTKGPSACIDTTGTGYCGTSGGAGNYFFLSAAAELLGLVSTSVFAQASSKAFEFDMNFGSSVFSESLHIAYDATKGAFAAATDTEFNPPDITIGGSGPIPQFTIPTPKISLCVAVGTMAPSAAPCADGWMPTGNDYFHLHFAFTWGSVNFDGSVDLDLASNGSAMGNFGDFIIQLLLNSPKIILEAILASVELVGQLLYQLGLAFYEALKAIAEFFVKTVAAIFDLIIDIFNPLNLCAAGTADAAMGSNQTASAVNRMPAVLADLADSPQGQTLLHHYYLNQTEITRLARGASVGPKPVAYTGSEVGTFLEFTRAITIVASDQLRESLAEMQSILEPYSGASYQELAVALKA